MQLGFVDVLLFGGSFKIKVKVLRWTNWVHQSEKHWQNHSTKAFFKVKDKEIVYISQSDLGAFQLIFKDNNSTTNA